MVTFEDLKQKQKEAFNVIIDAIKKRNGSHVTLNGPAGTGKTTLTKFIIEHLVRSGEMGIILAAPTHTAKKILTKLSGMEASTIHRILKINPNTYEDQDIFEQREVPDLSKCNVLICDEASMYDSPLFKILMASIPSWCTVIAIGDRNQLQPVAPGETSGQISPFFTHSAFKQIALEEVVRSNAPIIDVATEIREGGWFRDHVVDDHGVHGFTSGTALKDFMMNYFSIVKDPDYLIENRMFAYTNKSVNKLNSVIRKRLYETVTPYINNEILVMQEPFIKELAFDNKKFIEVIFNNSQLVRIKDAVYTSKFLKCKGVSHQQMINYWDLEVETAEDDEDYYCERIHVLAEDQIDKFNMFLAKVATTYKEMKASGQRPQWADFWKAKRSFVKVRALPCSTIHKSQGMSVDKSFIYTPCIHIADGQLAQQLAYVSVTRARHDAYYV